MWPNISFVTENGPQEKKRLRTTGLNRIIRIATFSSIYTPTNTMYKQLNILKISDIYHLELGKFMYQLYSDRLPAVFAQLFKKIKEIHSHNTRQTEKSTYFLLRVYKTIGQQLLTFRGVKLWYSIDDTITDRHWVSALCIWSDK